LKIKNFIRKVLSKQAPTASGAAPTLEVQLYDVTPFAAEIDLASLEVIRWAPAWMTRAERLILYALIFALRPARYLEIGTFQGGSALIVAAAMEAVGSKGRMICVDPEPKIDPEHWKRIQNRASLLRAYSPDILPHACEVAGGKFDFVLIDGDHTSTGVFRDAKGVLPFVIDGGYLLFHDSFYTEIAQALDNFAAENMAQLADFGSLTREVTVPEQSQTRPVRWGGLRMMQVRRSVSAR
jgi:predicted O-methyltransferase YrrM